MHLQIAVPEELEVARLQGAVLLFAGERAVVFAVDERDADSSYW